MIRSSVEQELRTQGKCMIRTSGISMEPMLHHQKSSVVLETVSRPLHRNDVVLFKRKDGRLVLHRVTKVRENSYVIVGDNCVDREIVPKENVIGLMTGFYPDESDRFVTTEDPGYQKYIKSLPARYAVRWCGYLPGRVIGKIQKCFNRPKGSK